MGLGATTEVEVATKEEEEEDTDTTTMAPEEEMQEVLLVVQDLVVGKLDEIGCGGHLGSVQY